MTADRRMWMVECWVAFCQLCWWWTSSGSDSELSDGHNSSHPVRESQSPFSDFKQSRLKCVYRIQRNIQGIRRHVSWCCADILTSRNHHDSQLHQQQLCWRVAVVQLWGQWQRLAGMSAAAAAFHPQQLPTWVQSVCWLVFSVRPGFTLTGPSKVHVPVSSHPNTS